MYGLLSFIFYYWYVVTKDSAFSISGCNVCFMLTFFRQQEWLHRSGRAVALAKHTPQQLAKLVVCSNHFIDCQYVPRSVCQFPSLHLPVSDAVPSPPLSASAARKEVLRPVSNTNDCGYRAWGLLMAYQANGGENDLHRYIKHLWPLPEVAPTLQLLLAQRPALAAVDNMERLPQFDKYVKIGLHFFFIYVVSDCLLHVFKLQLFSKPLDAQSSRLGPF